MWWAQQTQLLPRMRLKVLFMSPVSVTTPPAIMGEHVTSCSCLVALCLPVTALCISLEISVRQVSRKGFCFFFCPLLVFQLRVCFFSPSRPLSCVTYAHKLFHSAQWPPQLFYQGVANKLRLLIYIRRSYLANRFSLELWVMWIIQDKELMKWGLHMSRQKPWPCAHDHL